LLIILWVIDMESQALGLIETIGYIPAIEAADIAAKTAEIKIQGLKRVGQGRVTVVFYGDISTVRAAVDAGKSAAGKLGIVLSTTVIGRPADGLSGMFNSSKPQSAKQADHTGRKHAKGFQDTDSSTDVGFLEKLTVVKLRQIAREIAEFPMSRQEIKYARKTKLVELLTKCNWQREK